MKRPQTQVSRMRLLCCRPLQIELGICPAEGVQLIAYGPIGSRETPGWPNVNAPSRLDVRLSLLHSS